MAEYGLLIDNKYCTGCHSCEISCRNEHNLPLGQWGIKILELGPWQLEDKKHWEHRYVPIPTSLCDLCADRTAAGERPACVLHCLASCMEYGPVDELSKKMKESGNKVSLFVP